MCTLTLVCVCVCVCVCDCVWWCACVHACTVGVCVSIMCVLLLCMLSSHLSASCAFFSARLGLTVYLYLISRLSGTYKCCDSSILVLHIVD